MLSSRFPTQKDKKYLNTRKNYLKFSLFTKLNNLDTNLSKILEFKKPFFQIMPLDQVMTLCYSTLLVYANVYLYKFLKSQEITYIEGILKHKKEKNLKKIRKRNFVPAGYGIIHSVMLSLTYICEQSFWFSFGLNLVKLKG